jgi:hypothetical protein
VQQRDGAELQIAALGRQAGPAQAVVSGVVRLLHQFRNKV